MDIAQPFEMEVFVKWLAWLLNLSVLFGCAYGKMGVVDTPLSSGLITKKTPIFVEAVDAKDTQFTGDKAEDTVRLRQERAEIQSRYARMIADELRKKGYNAHAAAGKKTSGIVITGKVTRFEHGSGAARLFVGMGAGSSNLFTDFTVEDRTKKKVLSRFEVIATSGGRGGIYGVGGFIQAHLIDGSEQVAKYIDEKSKAE